ncbi:MAG: hypothetical protein V1818_01510 [Candidatus Aenigmatarchaeota archaeon]
MAKVLLRLSSVLLSLILLSTSAYSINIGSVIKNDFAETSINESASFKILFWNSGNESYALKLAVSGQPEGWAVIIDPEEFVLNKSVGEEYISLPYMNENIRAKVVNVFVKPDSESLSGNYSVTIVSGAVYDTPYLLTVVPKTSFVLRIGLKGGRTENKEAEVQNAKENIDNEIAEVMIDGEESSDSVLLLVLVFLILGAAIAVYKKS